MRPFVHRRPDQFLAYQVLREILERLKETGEWQAFSGPFKPTETPKNPENSLVRY